VRGCGASPPTETRNGLYAGPSTRDKTGKHAKPHYDREMKPSPKGGTRGNFGWRAEETRTRRNGSGPGEGFTELPLPMEQP